ncbi:hypothetical protein DFS34DRAFT_508191 [Phlyctochytrium arcticum]|nr:hypothetical protein DFS34DRAFT_508191 [Phlyctochytrium arcticum]
MSNLLVNPRFPANWSYEQENFLIHADPLSQNFQTFRPMKDTFDSRSSGSTIVIPVDSNSSYLRPQQGFLSGNINVFNADGTPYTNATLASVGIAGIFRKRGIVMGGKEVDGSQIDDYGQLAWDEYREASATKKKWLKRYEAYQNPDVFKNAKGEYTFKHIVLSGILDNPRFQPLPLPHLPNKAMEK